MTLLGLRAYIALALIILGPMATRSGDAGVDRGQLAPPVSTLDAGGDFTFPDSAAVSGLVSNSAPVNGQSDVALGASLVALSSFSHPGESADGWTSVDRDELSGTVGDLVLSPLIDRLGRESFLETTSVYAEAKLLQTGKPARIGFERVGDPEGARSAVPEPPVLILMLLGLPLLVRRRRAGMAR